MRLLCSACVTVWFIACGQPRAAVLPPPPLFYAVIADSQRDDHDPLTELRWAIAEVNRWQPDMVLVPGDLTKNASDIQYRDVMTVYRTLTAPTIMVPGNHEGPCGEHAYRTRFQEFTGQPPYSHHVLRGWHVFALDSVRFHRGKLDHEGGIDQDQLLWIRDQLQRVPANAPILLTQHHPLNYPVSQVSNEAELLAAFAAHRLLYTVTGHKHLNRLYRDTAAIQHVVTGSISFSCDRPACGIGYRLVSTIGNDLWTTWVETTAPAPVSASVSREIPLASGQTWTFTMPAAAAETQLCLRASYQGQGLRLRLAGLSQSMAEAAATRESLAPGETPGSVILDLPPAAGDTASLFLPLPGPLPDSGKTLELTVIQGQGQLTALSVMASTTAWQYARLKNPGETAVRLQLYSPLPGTATPSNRVPLLLQVEGLPQGEEPLLLINDTPTPISAGHYVALGFAANGLQSASHGFVNNLYIGNELFTRLAPERNVSNWETFLFAISRSQWEEADPRSFMLTAGTRTDGSGANPPENNEDYVVADLFLFDGASYLVDPRLPFGRQQRIGDNRPTDKTFFRCTPTQAATPQEQRWILLHDLDASAYPEGPLTITVRGGHASLTISRPAPGAQWQMP